MDRGFKSIIMCGCNRSAGGGVAPSALPAGHGVARAAAQQQGLPVYQPTPSSASIEALLQALAEASKSQSKK